MTLRLYDTKAKQTRDFVPVTPGHVGIYHCGLTVQAAPHVGHIRKEVVFDVLRRWFEHHGLEATLIANITDIDDKILTKSAEQGLPWWALAYANERELHAAYAVLGCKPPTYEPRATGHIPEMIVLIETLIDSGHAYVAEDSSGDVYFDVRSWPSYGELSNQRIDDMLPAEDAPPEGKRDPRDFALWKGHKAGEPATASWQTPWGAGRPGWHLECSAMAGRYLGDEFDIHGGGLDLRFPHHENELAQSRAAGQEFARLWMHNAMVTTKGEKMSKSLGNSALVSEVVKRVRPIELRYYLVAAHYRSIIEFSEESLHEAATAFGRIEGFVRRASEATGGADVGEGVVCAEFAEAMDDDLSVPSALAAVQQVIHEGNTLLADGDSPALRGTLTAVRRMLDVLGLDPLSPVWDGATTAGSGSYVASGSAGTASGTASGSAGTASGSFSFSFSASASGTRDTLGLLVRGRLERRQRARDDKDFAAADAVRDELTAAGIDVEDTPAGPRWSIRAGTPSAKPIGVGRPSAKPGDQAPRGADAEGDRAEGQG